MNALARTCLRLAAIVALRGQTMAEDRIFDSAIGVLDKLPIDELKPLITVYTEEQHGDQLSAQNGGPPFRPTVELILEIAMAVRGEQDGALVLAYPATSGDLELALDLLETQARIALFEQVTPYALAFRDAYIRVQKAASIRFTNSDAQEKIAIRYVTYTLELADEEMLTFDPAAIGLARLPPRFAKVASAWPADLPERLAVDVIAAALTQPTVPLLQFVRVNPVDDPPASGAQTDWTPTPVSTPAPAGSLPVKTTWKIGS